ncbi:hypothetical protein TM7_0101 [candidate division TM7 genomosp. GTL1]|nr:hypothetical protein TM7_0101 [candidate division TM7 genomosp. GTL1]
MATELQVGAAGVLVRDDVVIASDVITLLREPVGHHLGDNSAVTDPTDSDRHGSAVVELRPRRAQLVGDACHLGVSPLHDAVELGLRYLDLEIGRSRFDTRPELRLGLDFLSSRLLCSHGAGSYFQDTVTPGEWIHYVLVINTVDTDSQYTTGYTKIYKNGEQRDKDALSGYSIVPAHGTAPFRVGTRDLHSFFQGAIGKVAIYDYELPAVTVRNHYQIIVPPVVGSSSFIKNVGSASNKSSGTTLSVTVPNNGVSAGNTLIVKVAHEYTVSGPTVIDSKGNIYTRDQTSPNGSTTMRASIFSAPINAALEPGDTILLTIPVSVGTTGGAATTNITLNSAYKSVGTIGTYQYQPTLGVSESWIEIIASYKAGQAVITPPVVGTAIFIQSIGAASAKTSGTILTFTVPGWGAPGRGTHS